MKKCYSESRYYICRSNKCKLETGKECKICPFFISKICFAILDNKLESGCPYCCILNEIIDKCVKCGKKTSSSVCEFCDDWCIECWNDGDSGKSYWTEQDVRDRYFEIIKLDEDMYVEWMDENVIDRGKKRKGLDKGFLS